MNSIGRSSLVWAKRIRLILVGGLAALFFFVSMAFTNFSIARSQGNIDETGIDLTTDLTVDLTAVDELVIKVEELEAFKKQGQLASDVMKDQNLGGQ